jgi:hypothetical protein
MNRWLLNDDDDDCLYEDMKMDYNVRLKRNIQRYCLSIIGGNGIFSQTACSLAQFEIF